LDRQIVYPGSIPLDTDLLNVQRNTMVALGYLAQAVLGTTSVADGLVCGPTQPASMSVSVGPGSMTQFGAIDTLPYGSLSALPTAPLVRMGINTGSTIFSFVPPPSAGQIINYLIQASLLEADGGATVLPYYNAAMPGQPFSGAGNNGAAQMTLRQQSVQLAVKASAPLAAGSLSLPPVDAGWIGLYVITVACGQTVLAAGNITTLPTAPFLNWKMPQLTPGTHNLAVFRPNNQGNWAVPAGVGALRVRVWAGGGAGGGGLGGAGGGGAGGGYSEGYYLVSPGQTFAVVVGNGGIGASNVSAQASSFGGLASTVGGAAGSGGSSGGVGLGAGAGGAGGSSGLSVAGSAGGDALNLGSVFLSGAGGGSFGGAGGLAVGGAGTASVNGRNGIAPGSGGSGGIGGGAGGQGAPGLVLVEW